MLKILLLSTLIIFSTSSSSFSKHSNINLMENNLSDYLKKTRNCEVGNSYIKLKAESIIKGSKSTRDKAEKLFLFVRKNIKYERYSNTKQGALKTLKKGKGNCCDQAHALVALLRSVGIPARYQRGICQGASSGHIWAQTYVDGKWATVDPTNKINDFDNVRRCKSPRNVSTYQQLPF